MSSFLSSERESENLSKIHEGLTTAAENIIISVQKTEDPNSSINPAGASKNALKKAAKEAEKAKKKAETAEKLAAEKAAMQDNSHDVSQGRYGNLPLNQSTIRTGTVYPFRRL